MVRADNQIGVTGTAHQFMTTVLTYIIKPAQLPFPVTNYKNVLLMKDFSESL